MESFIECIRVLQQYMALRRDLPALMSLWDYIGEQKILSEQAGTLGEVLNRFDAEIDLVERIERLEKKQRDLTEQMKLVSQNSLLSLAQAQDSRTKCEQELSGAMTAMDKVSASIKRLEDRLAQERQLEARAKALMGLYQEYKKAHIGEVEVVRRQTYNQLIQELTSSLGYIESQIKTIDTQRQIVEQIKAQIEGYTKNESGLKAICQALSPSEGLIAQGLYSFMEGFVDQVNEVIARMWTYDLQVLPCKYTGDSVELDYKFPLSVPKSPLREDVSEGSEAMLEVVNFAFRWVAQKLLGYGDWPLFMDEFSRNFDDAHRATATHFIRDLIEAREFSQVFLISHYESVYGALQNADLCVIDDGNIALPKMNKPINEFVKINCQ
jgi:prefoldin subunit 5